MFQGRQRSRFWLGSDLGEDALPNLNSRRQRVTIGVDCVAEQPSECVGFLMGWVGFFKRLKSEISTFAKRNNHIPRPSYRALYPFTATPCLLSAARAIEIVSRRSERYCAMRVKSARPLVFRDGEGNWLSTPISSGATIPITHGGAAPKSHWSVCCATLPTTRAATSTSGTLGSPLTAIGRGCSPVPPRLCGSRR
jgi:hypothetical protein